MVRPHHPRRPHRGGLRTTKHHYDCPKTLTHPTLRMLTNSDMDTTFNFALLLIRQPTLRRRLKLAVLAALDQRISTRYAITGMNLADTGAYIAHHLKLAGRSDTLFSDDAIAAIHQAARGYPRAVNNLAVSALIATFTADKNIVDQAAQS